MIARIWHGKVPLEKSEMYHGYLLKTGLSDYRSIAGNQGVFLLKREEGHIAHFYTLTFWNGWEAIRNFAGEDVEKAKYYPGDRDFLLELEDKVIHFDVLEKPPGF